MEYFAILRLKEPAGSIETEGRVRVFRGVVFPPCSLLLLYFVDLKCHPYALIGPCHKAGVSN